MHGVKPRRRWLEAMAAVALVSVISACGSATTGSEGGDTASSDLLDYGIPPSELPVTEPIGKPVPEGKEIIVISSGVEAVQAYLEGIVAGARELGWEVSSLTYDFANPSSMTNTVDSAVAQHPDAVVTVALLRGQIAASIPKAQAAGVPLILADMPAKDEEGGGVYSILDTDVEYRYAADILAQILAHDAAEAKVDAHVLQLTVPEVASILGPIVDEFPKALKAECAECTVDLLNITFAEMTGGKQAQAVVSYLQRHPDTNYVMANSPSLGLGLDAALKQAGITDVKIFGVQPQEAQIKELQAGSDSVWAVAPGQVLGWIIIDKIARIFTGVDDTVWDGEKLFYALSKDNVGDLDAANVEFPRGYQDMFKAMWSK